MNKKDFFIFSVIYSFIYTYISFPNFTFFESIGAIIGAWLLLGAFPYLITHIGKNRNKPSRNIIALIISSCLIFIVIYQNRYERNIQKYQQEYVGNTNQSSASLSKKDARAVIDSLKDTNKAYKLMIDLNPKIEQEFIQFMLNDNFLNENNIKVYLSQGIEYEVLYANLLERTPSFKKDIYKYMRDTSDDKLYKSFFVENKHLQKNGCKIFPNNPSKEDVKETAEVKYNLIMEAVNNPHNYTPASSEKIEKLLTKVIKNYNKKGYNQNNLLTYFSSKSNSLSDKDKCETEKHFFETLFSLPKEETIILIRDVINNTH